MFVLYDKKPYILLCGSINLNINYDYLIAINNEYNNDLKVKYLIDNKNDFILKTDNDYYFIRIFNYKNMKYLQDKIFIISKEVIIEEITSVFLIEEILKNNLNNGKN